MSVTMPESRVWIATGFQLRKHRWAVPDICVTWPEQPRANGWFQRSPMLAIDVASRGDTPDQLQQKVMDYLENGAAEVCVIYPKSRTMVVYRPDATVNIIADMNYPCDLLVTSYVLAQKSLSGRKSPDRSESREP